MEARSLNAMQDAGAQVVECNPAPVLISRTDLSTQTELKRQQHFFERSALLAEDESRPQVQNANSLPSGGIGGRLPLAADIRQKSLSRWAVLPKNFVAAVAVVSGGRRAHQNLRRSFQPAKRLRNQPRALDAAVEDFR